ncbi:NUDIX domain-containing protein [Eikenella sp. S3360]|uniref:8-oxo-dGTP diphosphatase n=1 Tax=Eikenella glucosivorans TaxID=2766967 RepID=A0ABS0NC52_9NEIS|nr:NUDIX domain-containing protein [Eikenella glucosivorans]
MPSPLNLRNGIITFDHFSWLLEHADENPADLLLGEDLLQISFFGGQYLLDVGWYAAAAPQGRFTVLLVGNQDWEHPLRRLHTRQIAQLPELINGCIDWLHQHCADTRPLLHVVAGIVYNARGEVLLSSRPEGKAYAGYWEFAGGKVEPGEGELAALRRELAEELGIRIEAAVPWLTKIHSYEHARVRLRFFRVPPDAWHGQLQAREGQQWRWQEPGRYTVSPMLPANAALLNALAVPTAFSGSLHAGLRSADGAFCVLPPDTPHPPPGSRLLSSLADLAAAAPRGVRRWPLVRSAREVALAAEAGAEAAVWPVGDEAAAEQACTALAEGVALPLVLLPCDAALAPRYAERWLAAGAHAVVQG